MYGKKSIVSLTKNRQQIVLAVSNSEKNAGKHYWTYHPAAADDKNSFLGFENYNPNTYKQVPGVFKDPMKERWIFPHGYVPPPLANKVMFVEMETVTGNPSFYEAPPPSSQPPTWNPPATQPLQPPQPEPQPQVTISSADIRRLETKMEELINTLQDLNQSVTNCHQSQQDWSASIKSTLTNLLGSLDFFKQQHVGTPVGVKRTARDSEPPAPAKKSRVLPKTITQPPIPTPPFSDDDTDEETQKE